MSSLALQRASDKARTLVEALPYIRSYRGSTVVVKVGGAALDDPTLGRSVAEDIALLSLVGIEIVVVHGGGPQIDKAMTAADLEPMFVDGLRVTDEAAIEVVGRVLKGSINPLLVARLNEAGIKAVGLSGVDGGFLSAMEATSPSGSSLGQVGRIDRVEPALLNSMLTTGFTPVIASLAPGPQGTPLNVNADEVAGSIAGALGAAKLVYLTNVEGLYRDFGDAGSLVSEIAVADLRSLLPSLSQGMRPKVSSALAALDAGVEKVHILDGRVPHALLLEVFTDEGIGTQVLT